MNKEEFIDICKRMVKEYFNRYVKAEDKEMITVDDVNNIEYYDSDVEQEVVLVTNACDGNYYSVLYNKEDKKFYSSVTCM